MENLEAFKKLKTHFKQLYQMAISDENLSNLEFKVLCKFAEARGITTKNLEEFLSDNTYSKNTYINFFEEKIECIYDLTMKTISSTNIDDSDRLTLEKHIKLFGFIEENISAIADYFLDSVKQGKTKSEIIIELQN